MVDQPAEVLAVHHSLGSYGMGGPGFFGLGLRTAKGEQTTLIVTLWGADGRVTLDGQLLEEAFFADERVALSTYRFTTSGVLKGARLVAYDAGDDETALTFENHGRRHVLSLRTDGDGLPPWRGNGELRCLQSGESIEQALVLSDRANLWLN